MKYISDYYKIIEKEIFNLNLPNSPEKLYNPIAYMLNIGGKRIRPILVLVAHQLYNPNFKKSLKAALAIEVFHNFTLIHDDIMDKAPLRRGVITVHEKWDKNIAILSGDVMLVESYKLLMSVDDNNLRSILQVFNKAATEVCEGQQMDMDFETRNDVSIEEYLKMIEYKTSVLLAASLKIGAINGGATKKQANLLYEFGRNMGIAFQLQDDLLDAFGDPHKFGKRVGGDIIANKKTFLYLMALEKASKHQKLDLIKLYSALNNTQKEVDLVKNIFIDLEIPSETKKLIQSFHKKALKTLNLIQSENKNPLIEFSNKLIQRNS